MIAALKYELTRIRTIRSTWWLSAIALFFGVGLSFVFSLGISVAFDSTQPPTTSDMLQLGPGIVTQWAALGVPYFVVYILAMLGVFAWGHEYRHGMIRATLTALNSRPMAWAAKFIVVGVWVLIVALLTMLGSAATGWLWLHDNGVSFATADVAGTVGRTLGYTLLFTWLAAAFASLIRSQTAALVLLFIWPLAVESVITVVFSLVPGLRDHSGLTRFLPFNAGERIVNELDRVQSTFGDPLSAWGGTIIFGGVTAILMALSVTLFHKRDA